MNNHEWVILGIGFVISFFVALAVVETLVAKLRILLIPGLLQRLRGSRRARPRLGRVAADPAMPLA